MRAGAARLCGLLALCALLYDGSACLIAFASAPPADAPRELTVRAPCPCGCAQHLATLVGVGLSQPAAPARRLPDAPPRGVDHVPIALA